MPIFVILKLHTLQQVFYQPNGRRLELFSPIETESTVYEMDFNIQSVFLVTNNKIIIQSQESNKYVFRKFSGFSALLML